VDFDEWFPQGLYLVGEITPMTEYQSQEDNVAAAPMIGWEPRGSHSVRLIFTNEPIN
jgi:hypothetical protein